MTQETLAQRFSEAIELEQKCDTLSTHHYLKTFSLKTLAKFGLAIVNLSLDNIRNAMAGKAIAELSLDPALCQPNEDIPVGSLRVGDIVKLDRMGVGSGPQDTSVEGVVTRLNGKNLHVSISEDVFDEGLLNLYNNTGNANNRMCVVKLTNTITYKRTLQAMNRLNGLKENEKSEMIQMLLGERRFCPRKVDVPKLHFWNDRLNEAQKRAIEFALFKSSITIVHGPPGTGKTHTLIELIKQLKFAHDEKILVCGASNISVDNLLERLSPSFDSGPDDNSRQSKSKKGTRDKSRTSPEKLIRIGHPARLLPTILAYSLDVLSKSRKIANNGDTQLVLSEINDDIKRTLSNLKKTKRFFERRALWSELKVLRRELREREKKIVHELICNADVVLSTLHGAGSPELYNIYKDLEYNVQKPLFDTIIIDEVSQSLEPQCWIPLVNHLGCQRLVIAGDNQQLPPSVESEAEAKALRATGSSVADLKKTLFDRLIADHDGHEYKKMLNVQYRMNENIMSFPSQAFYEGQLVADESVRSILLSDLDGVTSTDETSVPCVWYDTQGGDFPEQKEDEELCSNPYVSASSKFNDMEVLVVIDHSKKLTSAGVSPSQIGVISPYNAQVSAIKKAMIEENLDLIEVSTIDGFQGREKDAIIVSLVRSNGIREVGFLSDYRRLNVAMTRPKRHLCVVGDMSLLEQSGVRFLRDWAEHANEHYEVIYPQLASY